MGAGLLAILPVLGGCSSSSGFWDRSPVVGGEYGRAPRQQYRRAPIAERQPEYAPQTPAPVHRPVPRQRQAELDPMQPAPERPTSADPYSPFAARPPRAAPPRSSTTGATSEDRQVLAEVNRIRAARGLRALVHNDRLWIAARDHSLEQMRHGYMGHGSPDKSRDELEERIKLAGYSGRSYAEVVAWGYQDVRGVVEGWMNSRPHRQILLDNDFTEAGFSRSGKYWTGNFGLPFARRRAVNTPRPTYRPYSTTPRSTYAPRKATPRSTYRPRSTTPRYTPRATTPAPRARAVPAPRPAPKPAPKPAEPKQLLKPPSGGFG